MAGNLPQRNPQRDPQSELRGDIEFVVGGLPGLYKYKYNVSQCHASKPRQHFIITYTSILAQCTSIELSASSLYQYLYWIIHKRYQRRYQQTS